MPEGAVKLQWKKKMHWDSGEGNIACRPVMNSAVYDGASNKKVNKQK